MGLGHSVLSAVSTVSGGTRLAELVESSTSPTTCTWAPKVIQVETAMGAAIEVFEGATLVEVGRERFVPVKTTNDLLVLRSDVYTIGADFVLDLVAADVPYVDLDPDHYKLVGEFDKRFPEGAPSMAKASSLKIEGDWTFGHGVEIVGEVTLDAATAQRVPAGEVLSGTDG